MALTQVPIIMRQEQQAVQKAPKKTPWDYLREGLEVAGTIGGLAVNYQTYQKYKADAEAQQLANQGISTPGQVMQGQVAGLEKVAPGTEGSINYRVKTGPGEGDIVETPLMKNARPAKEQTALGSALPQGPLAKSVAEQRLEFDKQKFAAEQANKKEAKVEAVRAEAQPKPVKLNAEERKRLDSASMGLAAVKEMGDALQSGSNTFSLVGDNPYTAARTRFEEAIGRMQSGGAISQDEGNRFKSMMPTVTDNQAIQNAKIKEMYREMSLRVESLGANPEEILAKRESIRTPFDKERQAPGEAKAAPAQHPQASAAQQWAEQNIMSPDPKTAEKARAILERLGAK